MSSSKDTVAQIAYLQRDLAAIRSRLDQASGRMGGAATSLRVTALSREVEHLCRAAAQSGVPQETDPLLATVRQHLETLKTLLPPEGE